MATDISVNNGSVISLVPQANVDLSSVRFCGIHIWVILQRVSKLQFGMMSLKIILL